MERHASAFLRKTLDTILDIPHILRGIVTRQMNTKRICIEEGLLRNAEAYGFDHSFGHLQELDSGERPRKRPQSTCEKAQRKYHNKVSQTSASVSTEDADITDVARDESSTHLAISISTDLVSQVRDAGKAARALKQQEWLLHDAERALHLAEAQVSSLHLALQSAKDEESYAKLHEAGERLSNVTQEASERRDMTRTDFEALSRNEEFYKNQLQHLLERTLEKVGLLDVSGPEPNSPQDRNQGRGHQDDDDHDSSTSLLSDDTALSTSEILRRTAYDDLYKAQQAKEKAETDFENRGAIYLNQLYQYEQAFQAGQIDMSRSTFDGHMFNHTRGLTKALIDAEEQEKEAIARAIALGLDTLDKFDPGPENRSHKDNGYGVSGEAAIVECLDRDRIYRWWDGVSAATPQSVQELAPCDDPDIDEWEAESVGLSDTNSAIDVNEYVNKIKSWKDHCGQLREERLSQLQDEAGEAVIRR